MTPLGEVWAGYHRPIEKYLRGRFNLSRADAEECVADAATKLMSHDAPTPNLLAKASARRAIDLIRTRTNREELEDRIAPLLAGIAIPTIEGAMFRADFDRAFRQLPKEQAEAFALIELRGLTERETAEVLGIPRTTIQRRCEAARTHLQKELS